MYTSLRVLCLKTIYVDTCMALIRKRQLDHKWKRRLQFGNITQLSCLGGTLQCSPESRASNWHIVYTSIYTGVQSIAISVSMHRMHNMPDVAVASSGVTDGGCAGCVGPIIALMNNGGWWGWWGPSQWIADVLSLGWLATNCTNLMPPSARIVCTTHCVHGSQRTSSHIWRWLRWRRSVCSGQSVAGPWLKFPHCVGGGEKRCTLSCGVKVCRTLVVAQAGWDSVLKLKFKCRQCVKAPLLVKDTLEVDNRCPSKHPRIGILLYLYFHLYPIQISAGLTERLFIWYY